MFYLISGYCIKSKLTIEQCAKKAIRVWSATFFYSVLIPICLVLGNVITLSVKQLSMLLLPLLSNQYWYSTCFIAMTMLLPFITVMFNNMDDSMIVRLMFIMITIDSIQPILGYNAFSNIGYGIVHAFTMYVIGYAIKRKNWRINNSIGIIVFSACVCLICLVTILSIHASGDRNRTISDYNSLLMIIQSVALFMFFLNLRVKYNVSRFAPYIFGIYLINDNQYARAFLWKDIFKCDAFYSSRMLPIHYLATVIVFMIVAFSIEWIRINTWKIIIKRIGTICKT